jgi:hypothetical protein
MEKTMQQPPPLSTPSVAPTCPDPIPSGGDPIPTLIGRLTGLLQQMESPPPVPPEELKSLVELLRAIHRQNTTLISRPRASLPWPQLVILTSLPVLVVLLILTFLRPSWLEPQTSLNQAHQQQPSPMPRVLPPTSKR